MYTKQTSNQLYRVYAALVQCLVLMSLYLSLVEEKFLLASIICMYINVSSCDKAD